jgi:1,4-dihydroxy-2-naphthoate octaprenyltransferase
MEQKVELPEANDLELARLLGDPQSPRPNGRGWLSTSMLWVRLVSLCLGLTAFFGGVGTCIGMAITTGERMYEYWAIGLIPAFVGLGLLIFYAMSARLARQAEQEAAAPAA